MIFTNEDFKVHADHLRQCKEREELETRDVAKYLNLAPYYISMALNPKSWDSMSRVAKERVIQFSLSRERIQDFKIPEGEVIWVPEGKPKSTEQKAQGSELRAESKKENPKTEPVKKENREIKKVPERTPGLSKPAVDKAVKTIKEKISGNELAEKIMNKYFPEHEEKLPAGGNEIFFNSGKTRLSIDIEINLIINGQKIQLA